MTGLAKTAPPPAYDVAAIRADFPVLGRPVHGRPLAFLDSAASAQKPRQVIDAMRSMYERDYANVHRGAYELSGRATDLYEAARETARAYLNARKASEIVFTRNGTEGINLVAHACGSLWAPGDEVVLSVMEHHANIVPWVLLRERAGIVIRVVPVSDAGVLDMDALRAVLTPRTRLVALTHMSNALGTVNPVREIARLAHAAGALVLFDGAQAAVHGMADMQAIDCDFYSCSGHKLYGPSGIGLLYAREALQEAMPPFMGGGEMIASVSFDGCRWARPPHKFEPGTPPIVQAVGLAAALRYIDAIGRERIAAHEGDMLADAHARLATIPGLRIVGTAPGKAGVVSFELDCAHAHDVATILDRAGVAVRAGHHCAQPLMARFGVTATTRASVGLYTSRADIDALVDGLHQVRDIFG